MNKKPVVSVLFPVGRDRKFLKESVASIHKQTFRSFEILLGENQDGTITKALNDLAKNAKGEFLARMDADDISEPDRFKKQIEFLKKNPNVQLIGTSATLIDERGKTIGVQEMLVSWEEIKRIAFFKNPLIHSSWMMRRSWFERIGGYNKVFLFAQDWELILRRVWRDEITNLPDRLLRLRIHRESLSFRENRHQGLYGLQARLDTIYRGDVPFWYVGAFIPSVISMMIPAQIKFNMRRR